MAHSYQGSCLCGSVHYKADGPISDVVACHCTQCRKQSGHFFAATNIDDAQVHIEGAENLSWFHASKEAGRGFCKKCGSTLFWKHQADPFTSVLAGSLDGKTGLKIAKHIFCNDKGDYYDLEDTIPQEG